MKEVLTASSQRPNSVKLWFHSNPQVSRRIYKTLSTTMDDGLEEEKSQSVSRRRVEEGNIHGRPQSNPNFLVFHVSSVDIVTRSRDCQTIMVWFPAEANIQTVFTANLGPTEWMGKAALTLKEMRPAHTAETYLHLVPRLRIRGAITPFLHISPWRAQGNFTLYFIKLKLLHNSDSSFRLPAQICDQWLHSTLEIQHCCRVKDQFFFSSLSLVSHENVWRHGLTTPRFLNLCPICNRVVTFMICPLQPRVAMDFCETCEKKKTGNVRINKVLRRFRVRIYNI
jgi:hypothetical protein